MVGYVKDNDEYRVWIPSKRKIVKFHDVKCSLSNIDEDEVDENPKLLI